MSVATEVGHRRYVVRLLYYQQLKPANQASLLKPWCGPTEPQMQCESPLLVVLFSPTEALSDLPVVDWIRFMCINLCVSPLSELVSESLQTEKFWLDEVGQWPTTRTKIDAWLAEYPSGRAVLIFTGGGTDCGRLQMTEGRCDPVEVQPN